MPLTLDSIAHNPQSITSFDYFEDLLVCFRPLLPNDDHRLAAFFEQLGSETRQWSTRDSYDLREARQLCSDINRYDKLRLVALVNDESIIALVELSLAIVDTDYKRFLERYQIELSEKTDARFGPCIADDYQNRHFGSWLFERTIIVARQMGKERLILWGGVFVQNARAVRFYERVGFKIFRESYENEQQAECLDGIYDLWE